MRLCPNLNRSASALETSTQQSRSPRTLESGLRKCVRNSMHASKERPLTHTRTHVLAHVLTQSCWISYNSRRNSCKNTLTHLCTFLRTFLTRPHTRLCSRPGQLYVRDHNLGLRVIIIQSYLPDCGFIICIALPRQFA